MFWEANEIIAPYATWLAAAHGPSDSKTAELPDRAGTPACAYWRGNAYTWPMHVRNVRSPHSWRVLACQLFDSVRVDIQVLQPGFKSLIWRMYVVFTGTGAKILESCKQKIEVRS